MKTKKLFKKVIVNFLLFSLLIGIVAFGSNEIVKADELADVEAKIEELSATQTELDLKKQQSEADLATLHSRKEDSQSDLAWLNSRSEEQQAAYETLKVRQDLVLDMQRSTLINLDQAKKNFDTKLEQYGDRIESMFSMQQKSVLELLLEAKSLEGFFTSVKFMRIITDEDEAALNELVAEQQDLVELTEKTQKDIDANEAELQEIQNLLDSLKEDINFQVDQIAYLDDSISEVHSDIESYAEMENGIQNALAEAQANADAIRAEMAAKAAEEKKRQEEAAAQAEQQNSDVAPAPAPAPDTNTGETITPPSYTGGALAWPVPSTHYISAYYGPRSFMLNGSMYTDFHTGIDIPAPTGTPFVAPASGIVTHVGPIPVGGNAVIVDLGNGLSVLGCHLSGFNVSVGQVVTAGQTIAFIGSTGFSTGPHLHFEVRINGASVDPLGYL